MRNKYLYFIVLGGIFTALASVLKISSIMITNEIRLTFYDVPIIIYGFLAGPLLGAMVGFATDVVQMFLYGYPPSLMTVSSMMWGLIPGLVALIFKNNLSRKIIFTTIVITSLMVFVINTYQLSLWYGVESTLALLKFRFLAMVIKIPIQYVLITTIYNRFKDYKQS